MRKLIALIAAVAGISALAETMTMEQGDHNYSPARHSYMEGASWTDGRAPHEGNDYLVNSRIYARLPQNDESLTFGGDKLQIAAGSWFFLNWSSYPNGTTYLDYPIEINDLVLNASARLRFSDSSGAQVGTLRHLLRGNMTIDGTRAAKPALIELGKINGYWAYNEMALIYGADAGNDGEFIQMQTVGAVTGDKAMVGMDFIGDVGAWTGTILVTNNVAIRIAGSMPGKVILSEPSSAIGSVSTDFSAGGEVGTLEFKNGGILLASPKHQALAVNDSFTKNGKIKVRLFDGEDQVMFAGRIDVLIAPAASGITAADFELEEPNDALSLEIEDLGDARLLYINNAMPAEEIDPSGYVTLFEDDPEERDLDVESYSFHFAGNWDSGEMPNSDNDYYVGPDRRFFFANQGAPTIARDTIEGAANPNEDYWRRIKFYGKSLTLAGTGFFSIDTPNNGYSMTIPDLRLESGSRFTFVKKDGSVPGWPTSGSASSTAAAIR